MAALIDATEHAVTLVALAPGKAIVSAVDPAGMGGAFEVEVLAGAPTSIVITTGEPEPRTGHEAIASGETTMEHEPGGADEPAMDVVEPHEENLPTF